MARIEGEFPAKTRLDSLVAACLDENPARRPAFAELERTLASHLQAHSP